MSTVLKKTFLVAILALVLAPDAGLIARNIPLKPLTDFASLKLFGQTISAKTPNFDLGSIFSGQTQSDLGLWIAERMGLPREFYIRLNNSLDLLLGRSSNPNVLVGKDYELYTAEMLRDLCLPAQTAFVTEMASGLKRAQDFLAGQGKAFVFVISPNKAAIEPTNVPDYCRQRSDDRAYTRLVAALTIAGVHHVDTEALARLSVSTGMPSWFGKYGQHWNDVGQFYAARAVIDNISEQLKTKIGTLQIDSMWIDTQPLGDEADTGLLSNFLFPLHPVSPHLKITLSGDRSPMRLLIVGTSFAGGLINSFLKVNLTQKITLYNYFKWIFRYAPPAPVSDSQSLEASEDYRTTLEQVGAIVVEGNASALNASHIFRFIEATDALRTR